MRKILIPKRMSSGKYIDIDNLSIDDIDINSINTSLNWSYRFTGHHKDKPPLTVAQHTKLAYQIAKRFYPDQLDVHLDCVLHDFEEAFIGDISTPIKRKLNISNNNFIENIADLIYNKYWTISCDYTEDTYLKRKFCDTLSLDIERRNMWANQSYKELWPDANDNTLSLKEKQAWFDAIQADRYVDLVALYNEVIES